MGSMSEHRSCFTTGAILTLPFPLLYLYISLGIYKAPACQAFMLNLTLYGHIKTAEQRTIIQQYGDLYTGR